MCSIVMNPNYGDEKKQTSEIFEQNKGKFLTLSYDNTNIIKWYVDA